MALHHQNPPTLTKPTAKSRQQLSAIAPFSDRPPNKRPRIAGKPSVMTATGQFRAWTETEAAPSSGCHHRRPSASGSIANLRLLSLDSANGDPATFVPRHHHFLPTTTSIISSLLGMGGVWPCQSPSAQCCTPSDGRLLRRCTPLLRFPHRTYDTQMAALLRQKNYSLYKYGPGVLRAQADEFWGRVALNVKKRSMGLQRGPRKAFVFEERIDIGRDEVISGRFNSRSWS
ncbi:hypothetical protein C8R47DRAFT_1224140 [Mycena vitilis]|nr:hypothetical protein C8R47DRAFT_1224140 [Mycena vitilis]